MRRFQIMLLLTLSTVFTSQTSAAELQLEFVPRLDGWQSGNSLQQEFKRELYLRSALDVMAQSGLSAYRFRLEGFVTRDLAEENLRPLGAPDIRKSRDESDLNEAWVDLTYDSLGLRVGRQPIRWSQSWTLPSLDLFSGRRFNRFFLDPLLDQLTHPDAIRITKSGKIFEQAFDVDLVRVYKSAPIRFAQPVANREREDLHETALRASAKIGLLDLAIIGSHKLEPRLGKNEIISGLQGSYAFNDVVVKTEVGNSDRDALFLTLGSDWFLDEWFVGPQLTIYRDALLLAATGEAIAYIPVRYTKEKWTFELDLLKGFGSPNSQRDLYSSIRVAYEFTSGFTASAGAQTYRGEAGRLLGQAQNLTEEKTIGFRLEYTGGLTL
ncbi:MAG: hypothetical protein J0L82_13925 [Deltaproteobacteria bacterium]|nr:hypothetical protein [Deltaproteobacteria bacterium]